MTWRVWPVLVAAAKLVSRLRPQGDTEERLGLSVTPFCDRRTVVVSALQLRFIDMFLRPLLPHVSWAVGSALGRDLAAGLARTTAHWTEHR